MTIRQERGAVIAVSVVVLIRGFSYHVISFVVSVTLVKLRGFSYPHRFSRFQLHSRHFVVLVTLYRGFGFTLTWFWIHLSRKNAVFQLFFNTLMSFQNPVTRFITL